MKESSERRKVGGYAALGVGIAAGVYASSVGIGWLRYGRRSRGHDEPDDLLDRLMPDYDVQDRHAIHVAAPAEIALAAACETDFFHSPLTRAVVKARELILGSHGGSRQPAALLAQMRAIGWGVLADVPGREIVVGAVTRPWEAEVTFRAIPPERFAAFDEANYVKIVWTLRADPAAAGQSILRTETRVATTDARSRARFRWYWACFSPGIRLIRWPLLSQAKREAERRGREAEPPARPA